MALRIPLRAWTVVSALVLAAAWLTLTWGGFVRDLFLPPPDQLWDAFNDLATDGYKNRTLWEHLQISLWRIFAGFVTGALAGTFLGLAMGYWRGVAALASPFVEFLRPLPQLAYLMLLIIWFGIGETSKIILLFLAALPVSAVAARDGVRNVPAQRIHAARTLGATEWQVFRHVVLPSALPEIFTGARIGVGVVYGTLIAAEIIAGSSGIGWMILDAGRFLRSDYVFVGIILIGLMGVALNGALVALETRLVHWAGR